MDLSAAACSWVMEDPEMAHQWELGSLDQLISENIWEDIKDYSSPSSDSHSSYPSFITSNTISGPSIDHYSAHIQKPKKSAKTNSHRDSPTILSFGDDQYYSELSYENIIGVVKTEEGSEMKSLSSINGSKNKLRVTRPLNSHNYQLEHVIAERKRRERLTQRFIALSAMVPGLKKMDKASVLGDAIEYIKKLEEKVKILQEEEEEAVKKKTLDKSDQLLSTNDGNSSSDENFEDKTNYSDHDILFEIEVVRLSENSILLKIRCQNHKGVLVKAVSEIENLHLTVINTSVIPFAGSLDMTVITKIEDGFSMTGKDLVKKLQSAFRGLM